MKQRGQSATSRSRIPLWLFGLAIVVVLATGIVILAINRGPTTQNQPIEFPHR